MERILMSNNMRRESDRLLEQIGRADSMVIAIKAGIRAEGFVLGLETAGSLGAGDANNLNIIFEAALENRLKSLALN
ncbi:hypothetical protein POF45_01180 [Pseudomonas sp. 681]|uniref:Uncharacterized protein n=1 Tax=Pseudomonas fungipugnans TaxID=3024217 RepID=A0ABT6QGP0_9PSED|nr:hypothetical protein [Pseudomonas sp. 681]MDI2590045.1 hypothetical protein [Pseudomonas sp. 681]